MLSIGKLAKGQEGYYLDAVARGVEDYYLEGEAPGRWLGAGAPLLGLVGEVDADALAAVLGYLERHATWTRRGHGGVEQIRGDGLVAAAFRHRTSRAGDPHLHTHVLVANAVRGTDGRWSTVDARHFYWHSKTAGYLYEAHLRSELTARLGVRWTKAIKGIADIDGVPLDVLGTFSTRRAEIEERLAIGGR